MHLKTKSTEFVSRVLLGRWKFYGFPGFTVQYKLSSSLPPFARQNLIHGHQYVHETCLFLFPADSLRAEKLIVLLCLCALTETLPWSSSLPICWRSWENWGFLPKGGTHDVKKYGSRSVISSPNPPTNALIPASLLLCPTWRGNNPS